MCVPSRYLISRGSVRRAELNLIRDVRHQLQFQANSQSDNAGGGLARSPLLPSSLPLSACVPLQAHWQKGGANHCENVCALHSYVFDKDARGTCPRTRPIDK